MKQIMFIIMLIIVLLIGCDNVDKSNSLSFNNPDSLNIQVFDRSGCITDVYSVISIKFSKNKGLLYTYGLKIPKYFSQNANKEKTHLLRKSYLSKKKVNSIISLLFENEINELACGQIDYNCTSHSTADGMGTFSVEIYKGSKTFNKIIKYPKPFGRLKDRRFYTLYNALQIMCIKFTKDIKYEDLLNLYENPQSADINIKEHIFKRFVTSSINQIYDKKSIKKLEQEFIDRDLSTEKQNYYPTRKIAYAIIRKDEEQYINLMNQFIVKIKNKEKSYKNIVTFISLIQNNKRKIELLNKCLSIKQDAIYLKAAVSLCTLNEKNGTEILLDYLDSTDTSIMYSTRVLNKSQDTSIIHTIINKYYFYKNSNSIEPKDKQIILGKYIYIIRDYIKRTYNYKGDFKIYGVRYYSENFDEESIILERYISKHFQSE